MKSDDHCASHGARGGGPTETQLASIMVHAAIDNCRKPSYEDLRLCDDIATERWQRFNLLKKSM